MGLAWDDVVAPSPDPVPAATAPPFGPLADTLDRMRHHGEWGVAVRPGQPDPAGWLRCETLAADDGRELRFRLTGIGERNAAPRRDVQASFFITIHAWTLAAIGLGAYVTDARVPDLSLKNVWLNRDLAASEQVALAEGHFWCLDLDPAAGHEMARPVSSRTELMLILRWQLGEHLAAVFAGLRAAKARLGEPAMWALAADNLVAAAIGQLPGAPLTAVEAMIAPFVRDPDSRFAGKSWVFELPDAPEEGIWTRRHSCCLSYKLGGDEMKCPLCPLRSMPERMQALRDYLAAQTKATG